LVFYLLVFNIYDVHEDPRQRDCNRKNRAFQHNDKVDIGRTRLRASVDPDGFESNVDWGSQ
jgi:hypothetical protein